MIATGRIASHPRNSAVGRLPICVCLVSLPVEGPHRPDIPPRNYLAGARSGHDAVPEHTLALGCAVWVCVLVLQPPRVPNLVLEDVQQELSPAPLRKAPRGAAATLEVDLRASSISVVDLGGFTCVGR